MLQKRKNTVKLHVEKNESKTKTFFHKLHCVESKYQYTKTFDWDWVVCIWLTEFSGCGFQCFSVVLVVFSDLIGRNEKG